MHHVSIRHQVHLDRIVRGGGVRVGQTRSALVQTGSEQLSLGLLSSMQRTSVSSRTKCDPSLYGVILGVVNEPNHWILTVIFPSEQRSLVLDPLGNDASKITRCLETTRAFMRARGFLAEESPTFPNSEGAVVKYRREIAVALLNETDDLNELCHYCGEGEEARGGSQDRPDATDWIQCDTCGRWYHEGCVGRPDRDHMYSCPACHQAQMSRCRPKRSKKR
ncbi:unnamed protein product [Arctogadus glacialis]